MVSVKLLSYLAIGTTAMLIPIVVQSRWYKTKLWKTPLLAVLLTIAGTSGAYLWFFIENHWIGGTSFFGAIFVVPVVFLLIAALLREPYSQVMDLCAPAECVMLAIMKTQCLLEGCCGGRLLWTTAAGTGIYFPSQIAELVNALVIFTVLMVLAYKKPKRGDLFPLYMVIYGVNRFVLNLFRGEQSDFFLGMAPGNVWSLLSIAIGAAWLILYRRSLARQIDQ